MSASAVDRDVENDLGVALTLVPDAHDLAVAHVPDGAALIAQPGRAQADGLDGAARLLQIHDIADAVLILEDHEDPVQEVLDDVLRAERDGHADDRGARDERRQVDVELAQDQQERDHQHDERHGRLQDRPDRRGALRSAFRQKPGGLEKGAVLGTFLERRRIRGTSPR